MAPCFKSYWLFFYTWIFVIARGQDLETQCAFGQLYDGASAEIKCVVNADYYATGCLSSPNKVQVETTTSSSVVNIFCEFQYGCGTVTTCSAGNCSCACSASGQLHTYTFGFAASHANHDSADFKCLVDGCLPTGTAPDVQVQSSCNDVPVPTAPQTTTSPTTAPTTSDGSGLEAWVIVLICFGAATAVYIVAILSVYCQVKYECCSATCSCSTPCSSCSCICIDEKAFGIFWSIFGVLSIGGIVINVVALIVIHCTTGTPPDPVYRMMIIYWCKIWCCQNGTKADPPSDPEKPNGGDVPLQPNPTPSPHHTGTNANSGTENGAT